MRIVAGLLLSLVFLSSVYVCQELLWEPNSTRSPVGQTLSDLLDRAGALPIWKASSEPSIAMLSGERRPLSIAFYVNDDSRGAASLDRALPRLDWIVPAWLRLSGPDMAVHADADRALLDRVQQAPRPVSILPMLQNIDGSGWQGEGLARLAASKPERTERLAAIVEALKGMSASGLVLDLEAVPASAHDDLRDFVEEISAAVHREGWILVIAVPFDDASWDYAAYADLVDYSLLMAYDQHWEGSAPGSIAGQAWFESALADRMRTLPPERTIVALGNYAYDWPADGKASVTAVTAALERARAFNAAVELEPSSRNPRFEYLDGQKERHEVWFLDAATAANQIRAAEAFHPAGYAVWRLGSEDPSLWDLMGGRFETFDPHRLGSIPASTGVSYDGSGEILRLKARPAAGRRDITLAADGSIANEVYRDFPSGYVVERRGGPSNLIALTFDDGPDPQWTPAVLDVLKAKNVRASFFVVGSQVVAHPEIARRVLAEGHDLGNHTFSHPDTSNLSSTLVKVQINATRHAVEAATGRSMRLFRAPYEGDSDPAAPSDLTVVDIAQKLGFLSVGLKIDPQDWQGPAAATIVERVLSHLEEPDPGKRGQIVLLHDAGGDRSQTLAALPILIDAVRARGFELAPASELAGLTRDEAMPVPAKSTLEGLADAAILLVAGWGGAALGTLFFAALVLGSLRIVALIALSELQKRREKRSSAPRSSHRPNVSVLIPAHNEAAVIAASVRRIIASRYDGMEVIVIDDGSTDGTGAIVAAQFGENPAVRLITTHNVGKAKALNLALFHARGDVVVALDADTQFEPDTIAHLARWFEAPDVGAVAGHAKVGNCVNAVTRWQALEYICAQNLERRAFARLGCITVVPGAVGAWRKSVLEDLGGFPSDTLAEDQDLTIMVHRAGHRVVFDADAIAWTEAPETFRGLAKQRFRWTFGTLQCLWKHRAITFSARHGAIGTVGLPQAWVFQVVLGALAPLVDLALVYQLASTGLDYLHHGAGFNPDPLILTLQLVIVFLALDLALVALCLGKDGAEPKTLLWCTLLQRFCFRQLLFFVLLKALVAAAAGRAVGWGSISRRGSVTLSQVPAYPAVE